MLALLFTPVAALLVAPLCVPQPSRATAAQGMSLTVQGSQLVDASGQAVRLLGVDVSGSEDTCIFGENYTTGRYGQGMYVRTPDDQHMVTAMKSWRINAVRVPLNESCWLGKAVLKAGALYRASIVAWVKLLRRNGLYVILDDHSATAGRDRRGRPQPALEILPMLDAAEGVPFWKSVASTFRSDAGIVFDLYNEPHDVSWSCWRNGCRVPAGKVRGSNGEPGGMLHYRSYRAAGMVDLVNAVRSSGAHQPVLLGGLGYAGDLSRWAASLPSGDSQLVASVHVYGGLSPCDGACRGILATIAQSHPVVAGEIGETDCSHAYVDDFMNWADAHGVSYLGWAWNQSPDQCGGDAGPSLITAYDGTPTIEGAGLRAHLIAISP